MVNYVVSDIRTNTLDVGSFALENGDTLYVTTTGQLLWTGYDSNAIYATYAATVTIAGQVVGDKAIYTDQFNGFGGSTVSVLDGGIVSGNFSAVWMLARTTPS